MDGPVTSPFADDPARTLTWEPDRSDPSIGPLMTKTVAPWPGGAPFQGQQVVHEKRGPHHGLHDGQEHQPERPRVGVDVVHEGPDEAEEPDTPGSGRAILLAVVGHGSIFFPGRGVEPGSLVTRRLRRRSGIPSAVTESPGVKPVKEQAGVVICPSCCLRTMRAAVR